MRIIETEADIAEGLALSRPPRPPARAGRSALPARCRSAAPRRASPASPASSSASRCPWPAPRRSGAASRRPSPTCRRRPSPPRDDATLRAAGLSGAKIRTLRAVAAAVPRRASTSTRLARCRATRRTHALTAIKGIGPWTADIYLLFCLGHADVFPAGDLALGTPSPTPSAATAAGADRRLAAMAEKWSPWRGVAARLFWAYYRARRTRRGRRSDGGIQMIDGPRTAARQRRARRRSWSCSSTATAPTATT